MMQRAVLEDLTVHPFACGDSLFLDVQGVGLMQLDPSEGLILADAIRKAILGLCESDRGIVAPAI